MPRCFHKGRLRVAFVACLVSTMLTCAEPGVAALQAFTPGQMLVMDSNAAAGNGQLFTIDPTTGAATPIGNAVGNEPWSIAVQSPTAIFAADATLENVHRLNQSTGNWTTILTGTKLLKYPSAAMVVENDDSLLVASGGGKVIRVDTNTGQQSVYCDYSSLGAGDPWAMTRLADGSLAISDLFNGKIIRVPTSGSPSILSSGGLLHSTAGIVQLSDNFIAVGDDNIHGQYSIVRVSLLDGSQSYLTPLGSFSGRLNDLDLDTDGNLLVCVAQLGGRGTIQKVRLSDGQISTFSDDNQFANPVGLIFVVPEPATSGVLLLTALMLTLRRRRTTRSRFDAPTALP